MRKNDRLIEIIKETLKGEDDREKQKYEKLEAFTHILDTHKRVLLVTGSAGAGKTDVLVSSYIGLMLKGHKVCCMASTALAAVNVNNRFKRKREELEEVISNDIQRSESLKKVLNEVNEPDTQTIHSKLSIRAAKVYIPNENGGFDYTNFFRSKNKSLFIETMRKLKEYDSFFIDEASMISANFMDVIMYLVSFIDKARKEKGKKPVRLILFGDFHQLSPVIQDWDFIIRGGKTTYDLYKEKYGGVYLFDCKRISERWMDGGKRFGKNYYFELKENHRINISGGTERQNRLNIEYREHLAVIKDARSFLKKADLAIRKKDSGKAIKEMTPLNNALEFFNKRQMSLNEFKSRKDVRNMIKDIGDKNVITIAGTNSFRKEMTDFLTLLFVEEHKEKKIQNGQEGELIEGIDYIKPHPRVSKKATEIEAGFERSEVLKTVSPLSECTLLKNMKVVITENCTAYAIKGNKKVDFFNGQICTIERFEKTTNNKFIPILKTEEGVLAKILPSYKRQRVVIKKLLDKEQKEKLRSKLRNPLIHYEFDTLEKLKAVGDYTRIDFRGENIIFCKQQNKAFAYNPEDKDRVFIVFNHCLYDYYYADTYSFEILPLEPAFALTYHKVQGQEADCIYIHSKAKDFIDQNSLYLGLSRGKTIKGLWISKMLPRPIKTEKSGKKTINLQGKRRLERILKYCSEEQREKDLNNCSNDSIRESKNKYYSIRDMYDVDRFLNSFKPDGDSTHYPNWFSLN